MSKNLFALIACLMMISCEDENPVPSDDVIIVSESGYANAAEEYGAIITARIEGDNLIIEFGASGCSGDSWVTRLYDQNVVMESFPIQRNIKFSLENPEACQAFFEREVIFDLSPIKTSEYNEITLNLSNYSEQLSYKY